jgi:DNA-binding Lrp family transcriptional regulator
VIDSETVIEAYLLIQTEVGMADEVAAKVRAMPNVQKASAVSGPYDVIVSAEGQGMDELTRQVLRPIQEIDGVVRTMTCPVHPR